MIALPPRREPDSTLQSLEERAGADLARRAAGMMGWNDVRVDSGLMHGRPSSNPFENADVVVFLTLQRQEHSDSVVLRITVRNTAPGTQYGFRIISSAPVSEPTSLDPFRSTLRDATRLLEQLRRLPPGQPWPEDMGRGFSTGPDRATADMRGRHFTPEHFDSLRRLGDSIRRGSAIAVRIRRVRILLGDHQQTDLMSKAVIRCRQSRRCLPRTIVDADIDPIHSRFRIDHGLPASITTAAQFGTGRQSVRSLLNRARCMWAAASNAMCTRPLLSRLTAAALDASGASVRDVVCIRSSCSPTVV